MSDNQVPPTSYGELAAVLTALPMLVRECRRARQIGTREAARQIGCSAPTISRFENGKDSSLANAILMLRWLDGNSGE